jgi:hypothetical protein
MRHHTQSALESWYRLPGRGALQSRPFAAMVQNNVRARYPMPRWDGCPAKIREGDPHQIELPDAER